MMLTCLPNFSAKELEHYQRVRATFEGPSKPKSAIAPPGPTALPTRIPAPSLDVNHLRPPAPISRPKTKGRPNTAKKDDPKGKGKAPKWDSDDDDDDDDEDAYVTSNDFMGTPERKTNGNFGNGAAEDDENTPGLYDVEAILDKS